MTSSPDLAPPDLSFPSAFADLPAATPDLRLVAVDMDGTLLDADGRIPDALWPLLARMTERGIAFAPASDRQYATLRRDLGEHGDGMVFIAENGSFVVRADSVGGDTELSADVLEREIVADVLTRLRDLHATHDIGVILCGKRAAYIERTDAPFRAQADRYYASLEDVDDLLEVDDEAIKIAIFDFADAETSTAPALESLRASHQVVVSGEHWVDIMNHGVNKGTALRRLQAALGVTPAQTAAFGDYLNDIEMLDAADLSFAMADAHPDLVAHARFRAPSHRDHGVITVLERLLG